jgi:hypothetical protein
MATNNENGFYAPQAPMQPAPAQTAQEPKGQAQQQFQQPNQAQAYGNLYQYPNQQPQAYPQFYRPPVPYNKGWGFTKDGFQTASVIICIIGIGMSASLGDVGYGALIINLPIFGFALAWGAAELILRARRKFARPAVHPGAHVAFSLIIWLAAGFAGGIQATFDAIYRRDDWTCYDDETGDYDAPCGPRWGDRQALYTGVAVLLCLLCIIHFVLFVGACSDTAKHNAAARAQVMIMQPPVWGPGQGYQPIPYQGQQFQQQPQYFQQQQQYPQGQEQIPMGSRNPEQGAPSAPAPAATMN